MLEYEMIYGELPNGSKYKMLPKIIDKHQYRYKQLFRKGRIALYEQSYRPYSGFEDINPHYEVIIIRVVAGDENLNIPAREAYPSTIDWGVKGWSYFKYEEATSKIGELLMKGKFT